MVLLDLRTIPRSPNIIFELIRIDEDKWAQERNEHDQGEVEEAEQWVYFENAVNQSKGHQ